MAVTDLVTTPYRVATSKPAQKTYLNTILILISSTFLFGIAVVAYILFYYNYVPQIGIKKVGHLQYGDGINPYSIINLGTDLISHQAYDITLSLHVPRSPRNLETGNFMLSLSLLSPSYKPSITPGTPAQEVMPTIISSIQPSDILFSSRRPALLRYTSRLISLAERLASLPLYILGLKRESELLNIPMFELLLFAKGWKNIPGFALLEVQAGQNIQVYDVTLQFTARFSGLRWWLYNHRLLSFTIGTAIFWSAEMIFTLFTWLILRSLFSSPSPSIKEGTESTTKSPIKNEPATDEEPDLSDTPRTFPTYGRTAPLRYEPKVKEEESDELLIDETSIAPLEADDESEEVVGGRGFDSGIGTSYSEGGGRSSVSRRRSKGENA